MYSADPPGILKIFTIKGHGTGTVSCSAIDATSDLADDERGNPPQNIFGGVVSSEKLPRRNLVDIGLTEGQNTLQLERPQPTSHSP